MSFDKPVVGHDKLGAADHSSVDQDARFEPILSIFGTESYRLFAGMAKKIILVCWVKLGGTKEIGGMM